MQMNDVSNKEKPAIIVVYQMGQSAIRCFIKNMKKCGV
jgi:hypothetical protein